MAVAFDAATQSALTSSTTDPSWTHTPVGTPRGVLVFVTQQSVVTDFVASVKYGSLTLSRVQYATSPVSEFGGCYLYFAGSGIPTGAQTVLVDKTGSIAMAGHCITLTASADTQIEDSNIFEGITANPTIALTTGAGVNSFISMAAYSGQNAPASLTSPTGYTMRLQVDYGNQSAVVETKDVNHTGGSISPSFTSTSEDTGAVAVAVKEVSVGGPTRRRFSTML